MDPILPPTNVKKEHRDAKKKGSNGRASSNNPTSCARYLDFGQTLPCQTGFGIDENPHHWNRTVDLRNSNAIVGSIARMLKNNVFSQQPPPCKF